MCCALAVGAFIILGAMWKAKRAEAAASREAGYALEASLIGGRGQVFCP